MDSIFGVAFAIALCAAVLIGLAIGSSAEGAEAGTSSRSQLELRVTRAALLATAAILALLGAEAALVAGSVDSPESGRAEATVFLLEGLADLVMLGVVLLPAWTLRRVWVLRLIAVCWLVVGLPAMVLTFGDGPLAAFYLGLGPTPWAAAAVAIGAVMVWLSSLGGQPGLAAEPTAEPATAAHTMVAPALMEPEASRLTRRPPTHWRGIVTGVALASLVAVSVWPMVQFAGVLLDGSCTPQWLLPSDPQFCVSVALQGQVATISGQTTLPDGALVNVEEGGLVSETQMDRPSDQQVAVHNGTFEASFDLSRRTVDTFLATAEVRMDGQPAAVVARYGSDGHALAGPAVSQDSGGRRLFVRLTFTVSS